MKRLMTLLVLLFSLWGEAGAETLPPEALEVFESACPGYELIAGDRWGDTAAAVMGREDERILCGFLKWIRAALCASRISGPVMVKKRFRGQACRESVF